MSQRIAIREMDKNDCEIIAQAFGAQGWNKPTEKYEKYFDESAAGERVVLTAWREGEFAGYLTIIWESTYPPFKMNRMAEIVDFNVLEKFRRRGIGSALMDEAENRISERSAVAGIGVGLTPDYGAAQILYVRRGYVPDGRGVFQKGRHLKYGDQARVDDDLALYLVKSLR